LAASSVLASPSTSTNLTLSPILNSLSIPSGFFLFLTVTVIVPAPGSTFLTTPETPWPFFFSGLASSASAKPLHRINPRADAKNARNMAVPPRECEIGRVQHSLGDARGMRFLATYQRPSGDSVRR